MKTSTPHTVARRSAASQFIYKYPRLKSQAEIEEGTLPFQGERPLVPRASVRSRDHALSSDTSLWDEAEMVIRDCCFKQMRQLLY
jgi:hypothetical protein